MPMVEIDSIECWLCFARHQNTHKQVIERGLGAAMSLPGSPTCREYGIPESELSSAGSRTTQVTQV
ncbi:hypothetical protein M408DRAFT_333628, partial [Serendipita vermifera MAFF 305830]